MISNNTLKHIGYSWSVETCALYLSGRLMSQLLHVFFTAAFTASVFLVYCGGTIFYEFMMVEGWWKGADIQ